MKLMIASDIHGSAYYCRMLIERYESEKPEKLILLGDILYHGPRNALPKLSLTAMRCLTAHGASSSLLTSET